MSALADIFASVHLDLESGKFVADAQATADTAGEAMRQRLNAKIKAGIGAGVGVAFGIAAKGAADLDAASSKLIADTGLVGDAAVQAKEQLASLYRDNLQGFEQIGTVLAKIHTDMGVTGDAAKALAQDFLNFADATGQDATEAVKSFDDILDSWGLKAEDATGLMDKLIVSHQKYGGEIADNEKTLAALAPAMKAANLQIDDGIALLGLFGSKGLDADTAAAAFAKSLTKVKSPAELQKLIKDIENTKDPFERAAKAADLFGARAGAKLANALGDANLDDYKISVEEAGGATTKAANEVKNSLGNQFNLVLKNAGGALAQFGTNFGPLILGLSQLGGPKVIAAVGGAIGGVVSQIPLMGPVKAAATSAGTKLGITMGAGMAAALLAAATIAIADAIDYASNTDAEKKAAADAAASIGTATSDELLAKRDELKAKLDSANRTWSPIEDFLGISSKADLQRSLDEVNTAIAKNVKTSSDSFDKLDVSGLLTGASAWHDLWTSSDEAKTKMVVNAGSIRTAADAMTAKLLGDAKALIDGYYDPIIAQDELRVEKDQVAADTIARNATKAGTAERHQADLTLANSQKNLDDTRANLLASGALTAKDQKDWLADLQKRYKAATGTAKTDIQSLITKIEELQHLPDTSVNVTTHAHGTGPVEARAAGGPVIAGRTYLVNEKTPNSELFVAPMSGQIVPSMQQLVPLETGGGGDTHQYNIEVAAEPPARDTFGLARELARRTKYASLTAQHRRIARTAIAGAR